ncbi:MAG: hypothetical protein EBY17_12950 [Acidobacteriia bacterium]|nr:hypothetical protein [Terriglobia bacterium]
MLINLSPETETRLTDIARSDGLSVGQDVEEAIDERLLRRKQFAEFQAAIAERLASFEAGEIYDGEEVMARLMADLPSRGIAPSTPSP